MLGILHGFQFGGEPEVRCGHFRCAERPPQIILYYVRIKDLELLAHKLD